MTKIPHRVHRFVSSKFSGNWNLGAISRRWFACSFTTPRRISIVLIPSGRASVAPLSQALSLRAALRADELERARTQYQFLAFASDAPSGVQRRAQEALALIGQRLALAPEAVAPEASLPDASADETAATETEETTVRNTSRIDGYWRWCGQQGR